jgi:hypothetical protein
MTTQKKNWMKNSTQGLIFQVTPQRRFATKDGPGYLLLFTSFYLLNILLDVLSVV